MIALNSVSKIVSRGRFRRTLLEDVSWVISPRSQVVILGDRHSGAQTLLGLIGGVVWPTSGWVDRRSTTSIPGGLLKYAREDKIHQLIARMSRLYSVDAREVSEFLALGLGQRDFLGAAIQSLPGPIRQQLGILLNYAFPVDFYLFDNAVIGNNFDRRFRSFCEKALELRSARAGIIMLAANSKVARRIDREMMGAVVYRGTVTLYKRLEDAIMVSESLPPESPPFPDAPLERAAPSDYEDPLV